jgi:hypothetical protein
MYNVVHGFGVEDAHLGDRILCFLKPDHAIYSGNLLDDRLGLA